MVNAKPCPNCGCETIVTHVKSYGSSGWTAYAKCKRCSQCGPAMTGPVNTDIGEKEQDEMRRLWNEAA